MDTARKNDETAPQGDPWLSVPKAARELGIANATVLSLVARGELNAMVADGRTFVHRDSIADHLARRSSRKQPA